MKKATAGKDKLQRAGQIARFIFIVLAAVSAVGLAYVAIEYGRVWRGGNLVRTILLVATFLLLVLFVAGAFMRNENRVQLLLVLVSTVITIYLCQGVFYLYTSGNARANIARLQGAAFDVRSKARFIEETHKDGEVVAPAATPTFWVDSEGLALNGKQVFPLAGLSRRHQVMCNENGRWIKFRSDRHGFNNPDEVWDKQPQAILIGDSFVHGVCVDRNEDIAGSLRQLGWKTTNLGVTGNGPLLELATLIEYGRNLKPKLVLWFYYEENDIRDLKHESGSQTLARYLRDEPFHQNLMLRQADIDPAIEGFIASYRTPGTKGLRQMQWALSFLQMGFFGDWLFNSSNPLTANRLFAASDYVPELRLLEDVLKKARQETESWGGKLVFVYLPRWSRYAYHESHDANLRLQVHAAAGKAGLSVFDFHDTLSAQPDPLVYFPFRIDGHYTPDGNMLLGRDLKAWVMKNGLVGR